MKISVMYLTSRPGGIDILWADMKRQTEQDFELVLVDALWRKREKEVREYINDPRLVYIHQSDTREGAYTNLAHADNEGFGACTGELIVCLQDYIWISPTGLEKYWEIYQTNPNILVSGVGDQYTYPRKEDITNPEGLITVFDKSFTGRPEQKFWFDPRKLPQEESFFEASPIAWEMNWSSIPRRIIYELGGMDEQYDFHGWACDNVNIAIRAHMLGYKTYIDQSNECMGFNHDGWWPNPLKVQKIKPDKYHFKQIEQMENGRIPIKYNYL